MKLKSIIALLLIANLCFSQSYNKLADFRKASSPYPVTLKLLGYYAVNDGGGGDFYFSDTAMSADNNGTIIRPNDIDPSSPGRYKRIFDREVNVLWFGAKRNYTDDASPAINAAINAANGILNNTYLTTTGKGIVIIPGGNYKMLSPIYINTSVVLTGEGSGMFPYQETRLMYSGNTKGIVILSTQTGAGAKTVIIRNLFLRNYGASTDSTADGLFTNTRIEVENVGIDNFGGNGFAVVTNDSGNANNCIFKNCTGYYNAKNGIFFSGNESNNASVYGGNFQTNGMCGVLDQSFIGNNFFGVHTSSNGLRNATGYSKTWCKYNGKIYQAIRYPNHKNVQPTVTGNWQEYWVENTALNPSLVADWNADSVYWITGSYVVSGTAATSHFYGCYSEGGQGKNMLNEFSMLWGGNHGAGMAKNRNLWLYVGASYMRLQGAGFRFYDKDSVKTYVGFDHVGGIMAGSEKTATPAHTGLQIKYSEPERLTNLFVGNTIGNKSFSVIGAGYNPSALGRSTLPKTGQVIFPYFSGYFMGLSNNGGQARNVLATSTTPPTGTTFGLGDFCLYMGTDTTIIGYRYVGSGNWKTLKAAN